MRTILWVISVSLFCVMLRVTSSCSVFRSLFTIMNKENNAQNTYSPQILWQDKRLYMLAKEL